MSIEEFKIRGELEKEVERELEEEIKDEIYRLATRLHRLYMQQKERETSNLGVNNFVQGNTKAKLVTEININIKMEGGTKIEIEEIKKPAREYRTGVPRNGNSRAMSAGSNRKKFDWAKSLRSGKNASSLLDNKINARQR